MKELVEYMARSLVDRPDEVEVIQTEDEQGAVLELKVSKEDLGKVIGRQGRIAKSMRAILSAASARAGKRFLLEIQE